MYVTCKTNCIQLVLHVTYISRIQLIFIFTHFKSNKFSQFFAVEYILKVASLQQLIQLSPLKKPGRVAQSVGHLTRKSGVLGSIPGLATYYRFSFRFFKKGSCQLLARVCARSTG